MPRRIVTSTLHSVSDSGNIDTYWDKVAKYIPSDIIGAWVAATGVLKLANPRPGPYLLWGTFAIAVILCALWSYKQISRTGKQGSCIQTLISVGAFCIWVYALGGPFPDWLGFYRPVVGSLLLIAYSLATGILDSDAFGQEKQKVRP